MDRESRRTLADRRSQWCRKIDVIKPGRRDHPQGYSNDLTLFGRRRGSGETIWDIKKHIGYVSSSLHLDYRVSTNVRNVILSGYFDSIGIYQAVSDKQQKLVQQWLDILGIDKRTADAPFHSLSWGQQRLALIVRALVKHPTLLILDEPLQGWIRWIASLSAALSTC